MGDAFTDRLSDYLDGEDMSAAERVALEAHLAICASCATTLVELREVASRAGSMPDAPPAADLWPGVAERLSGATPVIRFDSARQRRFSFTLPQLVAAGLALMVLSGGLMWVARLGDPRTSLPPVVAEIDETIAPANFADSYYDQAVTDLEKTLESGRSQLDPETVRILEENLRAIDQAIDQSRNALRADPANVYLNNHFAESRNRKLALLRRASALAMGSHESGS